MSTSMKTSVNADSTATIHNKMVPHGVGSVAKTSALNRIVKRDVMAENPVVRADISHLGELVKAGASNSDPKMRALVQATSALYTLGADQSEAMAMRGGDNQTPTIEVILCSDVRRKQIGADGKLTNNRMTVMIPPNQPVSDSFTSGQQRRYGFVNYDSQVAIMPLAKSYPMSASIVSELKRMDKIPDKSNQHQAKLYAGLVTLQPGSVFTVSVIGPDVASFPNKSGKSTMAPVGTLLKLRGVSFIHFEEAVLGNADKCAIVDLTKATQTMQEVLKNHCYNCFNVPTAVTTDQMPANLMSGFSLPVDFSADGGLQLVNQPKGAVPPQAVATGTSVKCHEMYGSVLHIVPMSEQVKAQAACPYYVATTSAPVMTDLAKEGEWSYTKPSDNGDEKITYIQGMMTIFSSTSYADEDGEPLTGFTLFTARLMPDILKRICLLNQSLLLDYSRYFVDCFIGHIMVRSNSEHHQEKIAGQPLNVSSGYGEPVYPYVSDIVRAAGFRVTAPEAMKYTIGKMLATYMDMECTGKTPDDIAQEFDEKSIQHKQEVEEMWADSHGRGDARRTVVPLCIFPGACVAGDALLHKISDVKKVGSDLDGKAILSDETMTPAINFLRKGYDFYVIPTAKKPFAMRGPDTTPEDLIAHRDFFFREKAPTGGSDAFKAWTDANKARKFSFLVYAVRSDSYLTEGTMFTSDDLSGLSVAAATVNSAVTTPAILDNDDSEPTDPVTTPVRVRNPLGAEKLNAASGDDGGVSRKSRKSSDKKLKPHTESVTEEDID